MSPCSREVPTTIVSDVHAERRVDTARAPATPKAPLDRPLLVQWLHPLCDRHKTLAARLLSRSSPHSNWRDFMQHKSCDGHWRVGGRSRCVVSSRSYLALRAAQRPRYGPSHRPLCVHQSIIPVREEVFESPAPGRRGTLSLVAPVLRSPCTRTTLNPRRPGMGSPAPG